MSVRGRVVVLLERATQSEVAVRELLGNERVADAIVGFHAQQAVEHYLRAVLASRGAEASQTHDLAALVDRLGEELGQPLPGELQGAGELSPWAAWVEPEAELPAELERWRAAGLVGAVADWAHRAVAGGEAGR